MNNSKVCNRIVVLIVLCAITIITFLPVRAIDIPQPSNEQPYTGQFSNIPDSGNGFYLVKNPSDMHWYSVKVNTGKIAFAFLVKTSANEFYMYCVSNQSGCIYTLYDASTGYGFSSTSINNQDPNHPGWYIYYPSFEGNLNSTSYAQNFKFNTVEEGIQAAENYISNPTIPSTSAEINYNLPPGNIAIIETDSSYSFINMKTTMPLQSTSFSSNPWPNTTQRIGYFNNLPQTLNPNTMGNVVEWERNGNTTLFNITTSAKYNPSVVSTFKYVIIANPYYYPANDMEDSQYTNGAININMDGVVNITVKSLTATVNTQTGEVEDNYNGDEWIGEIDETTNDIIWTDGNGDNNAPTSGGNLSDPSITGFQSWLKGILNNIVNIFEPAHDAISTLSGAISNFASWMYALYVWLPSPILSLLTSAISLAIVIGIIKVFI